MPNPWEATTAVAQQMNKIGANLRRQQANSLPSVPTSTVVPPVVVPYQAPPPPPMPNVLPMGTDATLRALLASQLQTQALLTTLVGQFDLRLRMEWISMISNAALSPSRVSPPILGSGGDKYTSATYQQFFQNLAKYPVGIFVYAQWNTPGGELLISLAQNGQNIVGDLSNGGPNGGGPTAVIEVNPGQIVYAANANAGVALTASDLFFIRVLDPSGFINPSVFSGPPWVYPGMPTP